MNKLDDLYKKKDVLERRIEQVTKEQGVSSHKSEFIGCKNCGSRLKISYLKGNDCPLCHASLLSTTLQERLQGYKSKLSVIRKQIKQLEEKEEILEKQKWAKAFKNPEQLTAMVYEHIYETIYDIIREGDFVEYRGEVGGDVGAIRVYSDGSVYER